MEYDIVIEFGEDSVMLNCYVKDYHAAADGTTSDTKAIQAAIDDCAAHGGGQVILEGVCFLTGMIRMKSGVELHIERDAVLLGSTDAADFPEIETDFWRTQYAPRFNKRCMIYAEGCRDIAITGRGAIDCQGEAYVDPLPEGTKVWNGSLWTFARKPYPVDPDGDGMVHVSGVEFPVAPRMASYSPGRVVFFIGCDNVLVEDVTMRNQPAGWSYWICDCEHVHFHRARIRASVEFPNNDGIHINCSRDVTVSDCDIACGDDGVVVRAYARPLRRYTPCERVTVTNCNIISHASGIRIGWINDGSIRNCTFSNLTMTDTNKPIAIELPSNDGPHRISDEGDERSLFENLSFSNIVMDRCYDAPITIAIGEHNLCEAIRNIYFTGIHAFSGKMPRIVGREDCHVKNIYISNSQFTQVPYAAMNNKYGPLQAALGVVQTPPEFRHVDNLVISDSVFSVL